MYVGTRLPSFDSRESGHRDDDGMYDRGQRGASVESGHWTGHRGVWIASSAGDTHVCVMHYLPITNRGAVDAGLLADSEFPTLRRDRTRSL